MSIAQYIDHGVLGPTKTIKDVTLACRLCAENDVAGICVNPDLVEHAAYELSGTGIVTRLGTVINFPHGVGTSLVEEVKQAWRDGAVEFDMVIPFSFALVGNWQSVQDEIYEVRRTIDDCMGHGEAILKVIIEPELLGSEEAIIAACRACDAAGADFVKTCTGFNGTLAQYNDVVLMAKHFPRGVKASGGIRLLAEAEAFIRAGATRIGTSNTASILEEERASQTI